MPHILSHSEGGVLTLTLSRVERKNALTVAMYSELAEALLAADQDTSVRVVLIQGHETVFCAGNDIEDFMKNPPDLANPNAMESMPVMQFLFAISSFKKPLLAAVCGPAVGIGTTMLLHCDLVYAGDNAAFSTPFVNLGLCAEGCSSLMMPQLMGYHRAAEALLLGEPFMAEAALEVGLVNRVVAPTETNAYAAAQARKLAAKPLSSLVETKRLMKKNQAPLVAAQIREEAMSFGKMLAGGAAEEAFMAFMEKRLPDFSKF